MFISFGFLTMVVCREWLEGLKAIQGGPSSRIDGAIAPHLFLPDGFSSEEASPYIPSVTCMIDGECVSKPGRRY
jgi:hypothetical protein